MADVNNRVQKFLAGNWGKPKPKDHGPKVPAWPEVARHKAKRNRKPRKPAHSCPFCKAELPLLMPQEKANKVFEKKDPKSGCTFFDIRAWGLYGKKCLQCRARNRTGACPCCKRDTWFKDGEYRHEGRWSFCSFSGRKVVR